MQYTKHDPGVRTRKPAGVFIYCSLAMIAIAGLQFFWFRHHLPLAYGDAGLELVYQARHQVAHIFRYAWTPALQAGIDGSYNFTTLPHFLFYAGLSIIGLPPWAAQVALLTILLSTSFIGFFLFCRDLFENDENHDYIALMSAGFYTLSPIFAFNFWGNLILSIYIPPFTATLLFLLLRFMKTGRLVFVSVYLPLAYFAFAPQFINPSFALPTIFFAMVFLAFLCRLQRARLAVRSPIRLLVIFCIVTVMANAWWLFPFVSGITSYLQTASQVMDPVETLRYTSESYADIARFLRFLPFSPHPNLLAYKQSHWLVPYFTSPLTLTIGTLLAAIAFSSTLLKRSDTRRTIAVCSLVLLVISVLLMKGNSEPFGGTFTYAATHIPLFGAAFRSAYLKFSPGLVVSGALLFGIGCAKLLDFLRSRIHRPVTAPTTTFIIVMALVLYDYPLVTGWLLTDPVRIRGNVITAEVDVPTYYRNAASWLNERVRNGRVLALPLRSKTYASFTWPRGYDSNDPTHLLLRQEVIARLDYCRSPAAILLCEMNRKGIDALVSIAPLLNIQYIVHQQDIDTIHGNYDAPLISHAVVRQHLVNNNALRLAVSFGPLDIYAIEDARVYPRVYVPAFVTSAMPYPAESIGKPDSKDHGGYPVVLTSDTLQRIAKWPEDPPPAVRFYRVNPTKYEVMIEGARGIIPLVLSENFDPKWRAYLVHRRPKSSFRDTWFAGALDDQTAQTTHLRSRFRSRAWEIPREQHIMANGYANMWLLNLPMYCAQSEVCMRNADGTYDVRMVLEYWPQRLFYISSITSIVSLLLGVGVSVLDQKKRRPQ